MAPLGELTPDDPASHPKATRVMIVDDHDVVALGLKALLSDVPEVDVVALASNAIDAVELARTTRPDVVLMDYRLPDGTGAEAARQLRSLSKGPRVVMITAVADRRVLGQALDAGCSGFVSKNADRQDLVSAIQAAARNDSYFTRDVLQHLVHLRRFDEVEGGALTERERDVLQAIADGQTTRQIADALFLSPHTVKNHLRHAMTKLDAHTQLEAVVKALRARVISIDD